MSIKESLPLRPRFKILTDYSSSYFIRQFERAKDNKRRHKISISDNHIFLRIDKNEQHFWSPQLHLELREESTGNEIHGLFGPNPTVWTMFMFLHFVVGTLFIAFSIWAYTLMITNSNYLFPVVINIILIIIWLLFYIAGRIGKKKARPQMNELYTFFQDILNDID